MITNLSLKKDKTRADVAKRLHDEIEKCDALMK
jgi:hypothetical protein